MNNGFYFAKEKGKDEVFTVYSSSTKNKIITDKPNDNRELEILCPVPDKISESVMKGKIKLLNMLKLMEKMR